MVHSKGLDDDDSDEDCGKGIGSIGSCNDDSSEEGNFAVQDESDAKDRGAVDRAAPRDTREEEQVGDAHELPFEALTPKKVNPKVQKEAPPLKVVPKAASKQPLTAAPVQEAYVPMVNGPKVPKEVPKIVGPKNRASPDILPRVPKTKNSPALPVNPPPREAQKGKQTKVKETKVKETKVKVANGEKTKHATKHVDLDKLKQAFEAKKKKGKKVR